MLGITIIESPIPMIDRCGRPLTPRQRQIAECLESGASNKKIARDLGLGVGTVKVHVAAVLRALDVPNRASAVSLSLKGGKRMNDQDPTPRMTEAIRVGCNAAFHTCSYPDCECASIPNAIRAAVEFALYAAGNPPARSADRNASSATVNS